MDETWKQTARERLDAAWAAGDALKLWSILSNPDNTTSRQHMRALCPEAPHARAARPVWRAFVTARFPALPGLLAGQEAARLAEVHTLRAQWRRRELRDLATRGPLWQHPEEVYPHALAFVEALLALGYVPETVGIGTVRLRHPDGRVVGPMRNKHLNAALALKALDAEGAAHAEG
jgi:hypothetical protein